MTYKSKLEKAVSKYQPDVERLFDVSLGKIDYESFSHFSRTLAKAKSDFDLETMSYASKTAIVQYNDNFLLNILPQSLVDYIAIHEMAHLAHHKTVDAKTMIETLLNYPNTQKYINECVADYSAHKILEARNIRPNSYSVLFGLGTVSISRVSEHAAFLQARLEKLKTNVLDYIRNIIQYEMLLD